MASDPTTIKSADDMPLGLQLWALLVLLIVASSAVVIIWGIADALLRPARAWRAVGERKILWIVLQALWLPILLWPVAAVFSVVYLAVVRPRVRRGLTLY